LLDHGGDQGIDDPLARGRAAGTRSVGEAAARIPVRSVAETSGPVVDCLAADAEEVRDVFDRETLGQPEQSLGAPVFLATGGVEQPFQFPVFACGQDEGVHDTSPRSYRAQRRLTGLSKNFWPGT
jgi:hypothetical protein